MSALRKRLQNVERVEPKVEEDLKPGVECHLLNSDGKPLKVYFKRTEQQMIWIEGREDLAFKVRRGLYDCAGILNDNLYFTLPNADEKSNLYVLNIDENGKPELEQIGTEPPGPVVFALEQPFLLHETAFESFDRSIIIPVPEELREFLATGKKFIMFYHVLFEAHRRENQGTIFCITCTNDTSEDKVNKNFENFVHIDLPSLIGIPESVITVDDSFYLICGQLLLRFNHELLATIANDQMIKMYRYDLENKLTHAQKAAKERKMKQEAYEAALKEGNDRMRSEIGLLTSEKTAHEETMSRLRGSFSATQLSELKNQTMDSFPNFTASGVLGEGGFGCVFEAENRFDGWKYAVKRVPVDSSKTTIQTALGEVRAMARLDHPNIVRYNSTWIEEPPEGWQLAKDEEMIKNLGNSGNRLKMDYTDNCVFIYIQMQMCKYALSAWLAENKEEGSRPLSKIKPWFKQIVFAVAYIHEKNLIHRDLKFEEFTEETAVTRTNIGSALYMSPEQAASTKYSSKTDVFALGLILAELCVAMRSADRTKIFDNYRRGKQSELVKDKRTGGKSHYEEDAIAARPYKIGTPPGADLDMISHNLRNFFKLAKANMFSVYVPSNMDKMEAEMDTLASIVDSLVFKQIYLIFDKEESDITSGLQRFSTLFFHRKTLEEINIQVLQRGSTDLNLLRQMMRRIPSEKKLTFTDQNIDENQDRFALDGVTMVNIVKNSIRCDLNSVACSAADILEAFEIVCNSDDDSKRADIDVEMKIKDDVLNIVGPDDRFHVDWDHTCFGVYDVARCGRLFMDWEPNSGIAHIMMSRMDRNDWESDEEEDEDGYDDCDDEEMDDEEEEEEEENDNYE